MLVRPSGGGKGDFLQQQFCTMISGTSVSMTARDFKVARKFSGSVSGWCTRSAGRRIRDLDGPDGGSGDG